jgi:hypothetical protein
MDRVQGADAEGSARVQLDQISLNFPLRWLGPATGVRCGGRARRLVALGLSTFGGVVVRWTIFFNLLEVNNFLSQGTRPVSVNGRKKKKHFSSRLDVHRFSPAYLRILFGVNSRVLK